MTPNQSPTLGGGNSAFDYNLFLSKIARRRPSSRYQQEHNFIELFRLAGIERMKKEVNMRHYGQRMEYGLGI